MIWHPQPGQQVRLNYQCKAMPYQGCVGVVEHVGRKPGPINALVRCTDNRLVVVPRGNLNRKERE